MLKEFIPEKWRKPIYFIFAVIGLTLTSFQTGYSSADLGQPLWLVIAWPIYGLWATAVGALAGSNVSGTRLVVPDGDGKRRADG